MIKQIGHLPGAGPGRSPVEPQKTPDASFGEALERATGRQNDVRLSAHARERLESRQIVLTDQHRARLDDAVTRAGEKGANQSLVLLDDLALVVSVRNKVVITALDESKAKSGVFTNIDSAVIA